MRIAKWGNSLAVRLPKKVVDDLNLSEGDEIEIAAVGPKAYAIEKRDRRAEFLAAMDQFHWAAPEGYKFDRDEAAER